jgi:hypothetical protein
VGIDKSIRHSWRLHALTCPTTDCFLENLYKATLLDYWSHYYPRSSFMDFTRAHLRAYDAAREKRKGYSLTTSQFLQTGYNLGHHDPNQRRGWHWTSVRFCTSIRARAITVKAAFRITLVSASAFPRAHHQRNMSGASQISQAAPSQLALSMSDSTINGRQLSRSQLRSDSISE